MEGEREGEKYWYARETVIDRSPLIHPQPGAWPTAQACALTGNQTGDLWVCEMMHNPPGHTSQGNFSSF